MNFMSLRETDVNTVLPDTAAHLFPRALLRALPPMGYRESGESSYSGARGLRLRALRRAVAFMEQNVGERLTLSEVSAIAGISRFHFARLFRQIIGCSAMNYQMGLRIDRGKQMLERSDASICEIAASLGFCDQSHFNRTFRRIAGLAPGDYARQTALAAASRALNPSGGGT